MSIITKTDLARELRALQQRVAELQSEHNGRAEFFQAMADAAPLMIWRSGADGLCTFASKALLSFRGRAMEQEVGNGWTEGIHPEDLSGCVHTYLTAFHARQPFQARFRLRRHDGEYRWILDSGVPVHSGGGAFAGFVGSGVAVDDLNANAHSPAAARVPLTARETQVLVLIADGNSTKELAAALGISYKTADSHRSNIMDKLNIHDTATLVRYALRHNLVEP